MDKRNRTKVKRYIFYLIGVGFIFGFIPPLISRYISDSEIYAWEWFAFVIISGLFALFLKLYFPKFKKAGEI